MCPRCASTYNTLRARSGTGTGAVSGVTDVIAAVRPLATTHMSDEPVRAERFHLAVYAHSACLAAARLAAQRSSTRPGTSPSATQLLRTPLRFPQRMPIRIVHAASRGRAGNEDVHK
jgi:hypothetical protein